MKNLSFIILLFLSTIVSAQTPVYNSYPAAKAVIFLDFDGHLVNGTNWNIFGPIDCAPANLTAEQITEVYNRVAEDYRPFNINITTDSTKYINAPVKQRMRVVLTTTNEWYGSHAGGTAYVNSFTWGNTPCFIFTKLFRYNVKNISEASSHEAGHTLGLRHQAVYDSTCTKKSDYNTGTGTGEISWAPIMGVGYYRNQTTWHNGPMPSGCYTAQDDLAIITNSTNGFGYRADENSDFTNALPITVAGNALQASGIISTNTDTDVFTLRLSQPRMMQLKVAPYSISAGDEGSNLDVQIKLYNESKQLLNTFNPATTLTALIDTVLSAGNYYVSVAGVGNAYASDYASLGAYAISGSITEPEPLPLHKLALKGRTLGKEHDLAWEIIADEQVVHQSVEVTNSSGTASLIAQPSARTFRHTPQVAGQVQYRLLVRFDNGKQYYSNTISLKSHVGKPQLLTNIIANEQLVVQSNASYQYIITDVTGRLLRKGEISAGVTNISTGFITRGIYLIRFSNGTDSFVEKFTRQ